MALESGAQSALLVLRATCSKISSEMALSAVFRNMPFVSDFVLKIFFPEVRSFIEMKRRGKEEREKD